MKRYLFLLLLVFAVSKIYAQSDSVSITSLVEQAARANNSHPVEKVYIHFDKPYYAVGDTVWFKAYLTFEAHQLSEISKVVNVDVINDRDSLIESVKIPVTGGTGNGSVILNGLNYKQGNYHFKAYTQWLLNFPPAFMFDKVIAIGSSLNKDVYAQVSYTGSLVNKNDRPAARILYKNPDGTLLASRKVEWRLDRNGDQIIKGKGVTDTNGYLTIDVSGAKPEDITAGTLFTTIETTDKQTKTTAFALKNVFADADVQFFPEGGTLVADVPNIVAFKAIKGNGLGADVKGNIVDGQGQQVAALSSQHLGMGKVTFTPAPNMLYKAVIEFPGGAKGTYALPRVTNNGISLAVNNTNPAALIIQLNASQAFFNKHKNQAYYLIAKTGGFVVFAAQTMLTSQTYSASIPKSKFKTGVLQLTLLSTAGDPLSERLVYIDHNDPLNITVSTDKPSYLTRQKVALKVATRFQDKPAEANMSVSVIDESKVAYNDNQATTIASYLLLTSDVSGYVEQPNYYFGAPDTKKADDLDVLMMTQGFRQFTFFDIVDNKIPPVKVLSQQGIDLSGNLRKLNGIPVFKGSVRLIIPDKNYSAETITDADGNFIFRNVIFTDSSQVTINARNNVDSRNLKITMNNDYYPAITKQQNYADEITNIDSVLNPYIKNSERQYQLNRVLKEVVIKASTIKKIDHTSYPALTGLNIADHAVDGKQLSDCNNFLICLPTMLLGVTFRDNEFYITRDYNAGNKNPMQVYIRGLQVDIAALASVDPKMVESVETFFNDGFTGINRMNSTNGIISVNMKEAPKGTKMSLDDLKKLIPDQNVITFTPKGYVKTRQFYSPKYEVTRAVQNSDLRTTIYWSPTLLSDKLTGSGNLSFYTSDGRGTYKAVIEGIDKDGNLGRAVYRFTVK